MDGRDVEGSRGRWKGGGGGGGGAILGTGLLVAGGPVEGSPWVSGVKAIEEEAGRGRVWTDPPGMEGRRVSGENPPTIPRCCQ